ncbi:MAG TPA: MFS transporter, partial [Dehalococcoidia bacterium]|nr:MFS transporter [Dehalococcoidia bacterium]
QLTHSPFLVQLVGASFFAPMFFAGAVSGVISDRLDRRRTLIWLICLMIPISFLMAVLNLSDAIRVWMVYLYMLCIGVSMVVDMTSRRALVYDLVGPSNVTNAVALESLAMTCGTLIGGVTAGSIVSLLGIGQAFVLVSSFYVVALIALLGVPAVAVSTRLISGARPEFLKDLKTAFGYLRGNHTLISILGVTVVMNAFYFPFTPMVPVFADRLDVNAFWTGILAGAPALGSMLGTILIARGGLVTRGWAYVGGSFFALVFLGIFAAANWYPLALGALMLAGLGTSGFATMQTALVMITSDDAMRGRALGLLSTAIGMLPFGMVVLGGVAQAVGPSSGLIGSVVCGMTVMVLWTRWRPESHRIA